MFLYQIRITLLAFSVKGKHEAASTYLIAIEGFLFFPFPGWRSRETLETRLIANFLNAKLDTFKTDKVKKERIKFTFSKK